MAELPHIVPKDEDFKILDLPQLNYDCMIIDIDTNILQIANNRQRDRIDSEEIFIGNIKSKRKNSEANNWDPSKSIMIANNSTTVLKFDHPENPLAEFAVLSIELRIRAVWGTSRQTPAHKVEEDNQANGSQWSALSDAI